jgi:arylsulfatase A-like enzyme
VRFPQKSKFLSLSQIDRTKLPARIPVVTAGKPRMLDEIRRKQRLHTWMEDRWTELRATYYGMCARLDDQFGRLMNSLKSANLYDDTAVFVFSDHGDFTGDYGLVEKTSNTFEDCLSRVPFLIKPPKSVPVKPRVSDALVELVDLPATVYELTGLNPGYNHFGRSLLPVLAGTTDEHRAAVFCEGGRLASENYLYDYAGSWTNEGGLYWPKAGTERDDPVAATKAVMCRTKDFKYVRRLYESDELYDLRNDPALAPVAAQLRDRLLTFFLETGDVVPYDRDRRE